MIYVEFGGGYPLLGSVGTGVKVTEGDTCVNGIGGFEYQLPSKPSANGQDSEYVSKWGSAAANRFIQY